MTQTWKSMIVHNFYISHYEAHNTMYLYSGFKYVCLLKPMKRAFISSY